MKKSMKSATCFSGCSLPDACYCVLPVGRNRRFVTLALTAPRSGLCRLSALHLISSPLTTTALCPMPENIASTISASTACLSGLPIEVLERILLHLPGQDIVKMDVVLRLEADSTRPRTDFSAA